MLEYDWPGNVRELSNMLERAYLMSAGKEEIDVDALPIDMLREGSKRPSAASLRGEREMVLLENAKRQHMEQVLAASEGNKSRAARLLGISRGRLTRRLVGR